jgi:hypothetical protein
MIRCRDPLRTQHRQTQLQMFQTTLAKIHTTPQVTNILIRAMQGWINNPNYIHPNNFPHRTTIGKTASLLVTFYNRVGWYQLFCGRLSHDVLTLQFLTFPEPRTLSALRRIYTSWAPQLIIAIWTISLESWIIRNTHLHGDTTERQQALLRAKLSTDIQNYYNRYELLPPNEHTHFSMPLPARLLLPTQDMYLWLIQVEAIFKCHDGPRPTNMLQRHLTQFLRPP